mmetsp:Transcript_34624/g.75297  ORF Transcript_34624/g.75297 Transcript_34624/m.75297 type:complete len:300 (+) Transcript_34624:2076-2975(+)
MAIVHPRVLRVIRIRDGTNAEAPINLHSPFVRMVFAPTRILAIRLVLARHPLNLALHICESASRPSAVSQGCEVPATERRIFRLRDASSAYCQELPMATLRHRSAGCVAGWLCDADPCVRLWVLLVHASRREGVAACDEAIRFREQCFSLCKKLAFHLRLCTFPIPIIFRFAVWAIAPAMTDALARLLSRHPRLGIARLYFTQLLRVETRLSPLPRQLEETHFGERTHALIYSRFSAIHIIAHTTHFIPAYFFHPIMTEITARLGEVFAGVNPRPATASTIEEAVVEMNFVEILPSLML